MATTPVFSDEQIASILDLINTTRHTQYIGARYVPIFGRKGEATIEWDNTAPYEPLTIVLHQGNSYTSRQYVPTGIDILNEDFWANTGNYNAQVEQYRRDTQQALTQSDDALRRLTAMGVNNEQDGTDLRGRFDQTETDAIAAKGALAAFGVNSPQDAENLRDHLYNAVLFGVDNTGASDASATIQTLWNTHKKLYFPAGTYKISTPITLDGQGYWVAHKGARFVADNTDSVLVLTGTQGVVDPEYLYINGGVYDGAGVADKCVNGVSSQYLVIDGIECVNAKVVELDTWDCHACRVSNVNITGNHNDVGMYCAFDAQYDNIRIWNCKVGAKIRGVSLFSNIYMWAGMYQYNPEATPTVGFDCHVDICSPIMSNIYIDGYERAFSSVNYMTTQIPAAKKMQLTIDGLLLQWNYGPSTQIPLIAFECSNDSGIFVKGNWNTTGNSPFRMFNDRLWAPFNLGNIPVASDGVESLIKDPDEVFCDKNEGLTMVGRPANRTTKVTGKKGIQILKFVGNYTIPVNITDAVGNVDIVMLKMTGRTSTEWGYVHLYTNGNHFYTKTSGGVTRVYIGAAPDATDSTETTLPAMYITFPYSVTPNGFAALQKPYNDEVIDIPTGAVEIKKAG